MATPPPEPISLEQAKVHLRLDPTDTTEDEALSDLITEAREFVEAGTGLVLVPRQITETAPQLGRWLDLASWPVTAVTAIRYPAAGQLVDLASGSWLASFKRRPVRLLPATNGWGIGAYPPFAGFAWSPPRLPVEIDVQAGYATPDEVPARVKRAMKLIIGHWYENRDAAEVGQRAAAIELPLGVADLLRNLKVRTI